MASIGKEMRRDYKPNWKTEDDQFAKTPALIFLHLLMVPFVVVTLITVGTILWPDSVVYEWFDAYLRWMTDP
ncbi:MAG: hypothetical protein F4Y63_08575 [Chloroflexi bacterium]|nr:hypothetical protein [Chloroflexota bacterium]MYK61235.1 hypothetical protein [Chloroflexota bacterium]